MTGKFLDVCTVGCLSAICKNIVMQITYRLLFMCNIIGSFASIDALFDDRGDKREVDCTCVAVGLIQLSYFFVVFVC